ncbi:MAG: hypothetical protein K6T83_07365 [Alicyclobacillus sp.]|nr:hypothetical protein [Alicyclobacillus sp.]
MLKLLNTLESQVEHLRKRITEDETGRNRFVVIPMEAGNGKSQNTDRIIGEYIASGGKRTFLIVKQFISEVQRTVDTINSYNDYEQVAVGITHEDWKKYRHALYSLMDVPVIVTTHSRYFDICRSTKLANAFVGRHTLIIDEGFEVDISQFTPGYMEWAESKLPYILHEHLYKVCEGLIIAINRLKPKIPKNEIVPCYPTLGNGADLKEFRRLVEANINEVPFDDRENVRKFVRHIEVLYNNPCLYQNSTLYARDESFRRFTLQNNIILDANGMMDAMYKYDPQVTVDYMPLLTDHSNWTLTQVKYNSSASSIEDTDNYWDKVCELIKDKQHTHSRTLVVCHKKHEDDLKEAIEAYQLDVDVEHFGNLKGKNDWREFDQVWIAGTPNLPAPIYPLRYAAARGQTIPRWVIRTVRRSGRLAFVDSEYESIRHSYVLCEIYQAVKRINRDNTKPAQVYVVTNNDELIRDLAAMMMNVQRTWPITLDGVTRKGQTEQPRKIPEMIRYYLVQHKAGSIVTKKSMCELLGINKAHLNRYLKHAAILELEQSGRIKVEHHHILVLH